MLLEYGNQALALVVKLSQQHTAPIGKEAFLEHYSR